MNDAGHPVSGRDLRAAAAELAELRSVAALMRSHLDHAAPGAVATAVDRLLSSGRDAVLDGDDGRPAPGPSRAAVSEPPGRRTRPSTG